MRDVSEKCSSSQHMSLSRLGTLHNELSSYDTAKLYHFHYEIVSIANYANKKCMCNGIRLFFLSTRDDHRDFSFYGDSTLTIIEIKAKIYFNK